MLVSTKFTTRISNAPVHCRGIHLTHEILTKFPTDELASCSKQTLDIQPQASTLKTKSGIIITVNSVEEVLEHVEPISYRRKLEGQQTYRISTLKPPALKDQRADGKEKAGAREGGAHESMSIPTSTRTI